VILVMVVLRWRYAGGLQAQSSSMKSMPLLRVEIWGKLWCMIFRSIVTVMASVNAFKVDFRPIETSEIRVGSGKHVFRG
jgi:hypothetical protein